MSTSRPVWSHNLLFEHFSEEEFRQIRACSKEKRVDRGEYLIREGQRGGDLYVIEEGHVEVLKQDVDEQEYQINTIAQGQVFGEMILFNNQVRSASVKSTEPTLVLGISIPDLKARHPDLFTKVLSNFANHFAARLEESNQNAVLSLKKMHIKTDKLAVMGRLTMQIFALLVAYQLIMRIFLHFTKVDQLRATTLVDVPMIIAISFFTFFSIVNQGYPVYMVGLTMRGWKKSVIESLIVTFILCLLVVVVKWVLVRMVPEFSNVPVFQMGLGVKEKLFHKTPAFFAQLSLAFYLVSAPFQEFIFRGFLQTTFQRLLSVRRRVIWAILVSNIIFAAGHEPLSWLYPFIVFVPGLVWGWLYARHRTLIGVSISHIILGIWALWAVGVGL